MIAPIVEPLAPPATTPMIAPSAAPANSSNLRLFRLAARFDVAIFINRLHILGGEDLFDPRVKSHAAAIAQSNGAASFLNASNTYKSGMAPLRNRQSGKRTRHSSSARAPLSASIAA
jgi:hypothetical protein